jgi:hypothetical protein
MSISDESRERLKAFLDVCEQADAKITYAMAAALPAGMGDEETLKQVAAALYGFLGGREPDPLRPFDRNPYDRIQELLASNHELRNRAQAAELSRDAAQEQMASVRKALAAMGEKIDKAFTPLVAQAAAQDAKIAELEGLLK